MAKELNLCFVFMSSLVQFWIFAVLFTGAFFSELCGDHCLSDTLGKHFAASLNGTKSILVKPDVK